MSEEKTGLIINLFENDSIYHISDPETVNEPENTSKSSPTKETSDDNNEDNITLTTQGNNKKGIIILFHNPAGDYMPEKDIAVLNKIFGALKIDLLDGSLLVNLNKNTFLNRNSLRALKTKTLISFGVNLFQFGFEEVELLPYEVKEIDNFLILPSEEMGKMTSKVDAKKAFWIAIQRALSANA